jgi:hypothetical protein
MTSERRKSIIILIITLVIGILLGLLVPGFFHKLSDRGFHGDRSRAHKRDWFIGTINHILQPDSTQAKQIKPITTWAAKRIDFIESSANEQMANVLDSVKIKLKPILTTDQQKRLDAFDTKAKGNWNNGRRHH